MRRRPNSTEPIAKRQLTTCNRCGCTNLAWVTYKSGKHGLVETALHSNGRYTEPTLVALRFNFHNCAEFRAMAEEIKRRSSECHPKASNPREILSDALSHIAHQLTDTPKGLETLNDSTHPLTQAFNILMDAQNKIQEVR